METDYYLLYIEQFNQSALKNLDWTIKKIILIFVYFL